MEGEIIVSYTRKQAIEDGVLVDVSNMAKECGIKYPVAVTSAVWNDYIVPPEALKGLQDEDGRLWDTLWMFRNNAKNTKDGESIIHFTVIFKMLYGKETKNDVITLKAIIDGGDNGEPVITILLPDED